MPDASYHFTGMQWWMDTSLMHPFPLVSPLSLNSLPGKVKLLQSGLSCAGTWEAAPCRIICVASKILHSSAHIASGIQIKAEGDGEALVPGIPWISLPTTKGLARAKLCGYCTATLLFQGDKGPFTTAREPWGVGCECLHGDTGLMQTAETGNATALVLLLQCLTFVSCCLSHLLQDLAVTEA